RRRHTRSTRDWSSDVCSSDLNYEVKLSEGEMRDLYEARRLRDVVTAKKSPEASNPEASKPEAPKVDPPKADATAADRQLDRQLRSEERRVGKRVERGGRSSRK